MDPVSALSLGRIVVGLLAFVRPSLAGSLFGFDATGNPQLPTMTRLFASREVALGTATLLARDDARRTLAIAGVLVDAADGATGVLGLRERSASRLTGVAVALAGTVAAASVARGLGRRA